MFICIETESTDVTKTSTFFVKIILLFGKGLKGLSLPRKFNNQATFSGALIKILSMFLDLIFFY